MQKQVNAFTQNYYIIPAFSLKGIFWGLFPFPASISSGAALPSGRARSSGKENPFLYPRKRGSQKQHAYAKLG